MATRHSEYLRQADEWYCEPAWVVDALLDALPNLAAVHDPCCGVGTVVDAAIRRGLVATGSDIADRAGGRFPVRDFLSDPARYPNIVSNDV
jgi:hypothetical protein